MHYTSPRISAAIALGQATGTWLLFLGLTLLVGCSGVSSSNSNHTSPPPGSLSFGSQSINFGSVPDGTSKTLTFTATNTGSTSVTISSVAISTSYFVLNSPSLPVTVAAGQSATVSVTFTPNAVGTFNATAAVTSNASNPVTDIALTGTGTAATTYSVALSWNASTSPNISGYNIYRAVYSTSCGSFSKINSLLNTSTLYTDSVVVDGTNYCYATTAVNSSNEESGYSNIVSDVKIPAQ
jgi:hypothetical protein